MFKGNLKWFWLVGAALAVSSVGLLLGKIKGQSYIHQMYERSDFRLLNSKGEIFRLRDLPQDRYLLLIFTPDEIHPILVKPFREFSLHLNEFRNPKMEVMLITRTNKQIVENFLSASLYKGELLIDQSGSVGRLVGFWNMNEPYKKWGYALMDRNFHIFWNEESLNLMKPQELRDKLGKVKF